MTSKGCLVTVLLASLAALFYSGCAPEAELAIKHTPNQTTTYKSTTQMGKDYLFDQPTVGKKIEKTTRTTIELVYDHTVTDVDPQGNATAEITIKELKVLSKGTEGTRVDFDSTKESDASDELAKLVGRSYTIKQSPSGRVLEITDIADDRKEVRSRHASALLSEEQIKKRHEVLALPSADKNKLSEGDTWSDVVSSPGQALIPKNYEKIYTVTKIEDTPDGKIAYIDMKATPTSKQAPGGKDAAGVMGMFGGMFESEDNYTGRLVINLDNGKILNYKEKLEAEYTAAEFPKGKEEAEKPDVLRLGFIDMHSLEALN